jgi:hypothetical protein
MMDHIVEQIDLLYWEAGTAALDTEPDTVTDTGGEDNDTLYRGDDLTLDK